MPLGHCKEKSDMIGSVFEKLTLVIAGKWTRGRINAQKEDWVIEMAR